MCKPSDIYINKYRSKFIVPPKQPEFLNVFENLSPFYIYKQDLSKFIVPTKESEFLNVFENLRLVFSFSNGSFQELNISLYITARLGEEAY